MGVFSLHCPYVVIHDELAQGGTIIEKKDNKACLTAAAEFFGGEVRSKSVYSSTGFNPVYI